MKIMTKGVSLLLTLLVAAAFCAAQQLPPKPIQASSAVVANHVQLVIEGKVINVHDGDTVTVLDQNNQKFHIRLQGIDAPELKQEFGSASQQFLARLVLGKQVTIVWSKIDKYRRTVGTIMLDGRDLNIEVVKAGLAWHFKKYADEQEPQDRRTYAAAELEARNNKLGLWQDPNPIVPGEWRQEVKAKRWGPPPPEGTIIGNRNSQKYHRPDCSGYRDMAEKNRVFFKSVAEAEAAGYKRAGNCPAETQVVMAKPALTVSTASPAAASASLAAAPPATPARPAVSAVPALPGNTPANPATASLRTDPSPAKSSDSATGKIIGNKNSKVFHLPGCASYNQVSEKNQIRFHTIEEATSAGYRLAGNCPRSKPAKE